ncbi:hypothetical protein N7466_011160 [Penicillium verhagenii]|uniref:uncharacterized protein n=1 Tax=Penicillium verhagenii TaxID=1562060 RepID=UPI0025450176|nr:uncharacterized protein N7466_011160 [Penicillium verhagenii]KAJ5917606.1 hypothetical protein N7466_011160 [Penicillium verhagenii]
MATSEAMEDVQPSAKRPALDIESLRSKKYKADDLPLSSAQHASIDKLLHSFKKKGGFDSIRKKIWADFNDGESRVKFTEELIALAESEIEREPAHLSRERGKAATLIEGAVDRSDVYKNAELSIDMLASNHLQAILDSVREIRRLEIGEDAARKEEEAGNKTDAEYEAHVQARREEREKVWLEEMRKQKEIDDERKRVEEEEQRKRRELEQKKEDEERARRKESEEKRRVEREREREEQRALDDREREERYERRRREDRDRYRDYDRYHDRSPAYRSDRGLSPRNRETKREKSAVSKDATPAPAPPVDEKSLEEAALQMLLREGEELAAKARQKPDFDFEKAEALENGLKPAEIKGSDSKLTEEIELDIILETGAEAALVHAGLGIALIVDEIDLEMHPSDLVIVIWISVEASVISVIHGMTEAIGQVVEVVVDRWPGTEIGTEKRQHRVRNPEIEIPNAAVTGAEIVTALVADLLRAGALVLGLGLVTVPENRVLGLALPLRDDGHVLAVAHVHDGLPPTGGPRHPLISTVMCRRLAIGASPPVAEPAPQNVIKERDLAKLIAISLALNEKPAKKKTKRLRALPRLPRNLMTEPLVGGVEAGEVAVDEGVQADAEVVPGGEERMI